MDLKTIKSIPTNYIAYPTKIEEYPKSVVYAIPGIANPFKIQFPDHKVEPDFIIQLVSDQLGIPVDEIKSLGPGSRKREYMDARRIAVELIDSYSMHYSLKKTGEFLGGRDHATILHIKNTNKQLLDSDRGFRLKYSVCQKELRLLIKNQ